MLGQGAGCNLLDKFLLADCCDIHLGSLHLVGTTAFYLILARDRAICTLPHPPQTKEGNVFRVTPTLPSNFEEWWQGGLPFLKLCDDTIQHLVKLCLCTCE